MVEIANTGGAWIFVYPKNYKNNLDENDMLLIKKMNRLLKEHYEKHPPIKDISPSVSNLIDNMHNDYYCEDYKKTFFEKIKSLFH